MLALKRNEVFGFIEGHGRAITCDMGADVTVVAEECIQPQHFTGQQCELKAFNDTKTTGRWCTVEIKIGDKTFQKRAVTQPGEDIRWSACLSLDMADQEEGQFLVDKLWKRAAMSEEQTYYLPPEVRDGVVMSGILATDDTVVKKTTTGSSEVEEVKKQPQECDEVPVQAMTMEVPLIEKEENGSRVERQNEEFLLNEQNLDLAEEESDVQGGGANVEGNQELDTSGIRQEITREAMAKETIEDKSLKAGYELGVGDKEGYHLVHDVLFRTRLDALGKASDQLCVPLSYRDKCL